MSDQQIMERLGPMPFRRLLDQVVLPIRNHVREAFVAVAVPLLACGLVLSLGQIVWIEAFQITDPEALGPFFAGILSLFAISLAVMGVYALTFGALTAGAMGVVAGGERVHMGEAWKFVLSPRAAFTVLMVGVINLLALMFCILPILFVGPALGYALPVMAHEKLYGTAAVKRSLEILRRNPTGRWSDSPWLQMTVLMAVGLVFNYAITLTVQMPFVVAQQVMLSRRAIEGEMLDPTQVMSEMMWLQVPATVLGALAMAVSWMYLAFGSCVVYWETRRRWEGWDLEAAIDDMVGESPVEESEA